MIDIDELLQRLNDDENGYEDPNWNPEWPYAPCGPTLATKPTVRGKSQALLDLSSLSKVDLSVTKLVVGADNRVYEPRFGLIECLAPTKPSGEEPNVYVDKVDWANFPPMAELAWLFDKFFSRYDREVLMLVGRNRNLTGWLYHVPWQEGTPGYVKWKSNDAEMGNFQEQARWIGTIHVHPGEHCNPSQTDIDDWAEPDKSGLHLVFGRDGSYTINGAIAGKVFQLSEGTISGQDRTGVEYSISGNRSLDEVLMVPKPKPTRVRKVRKVRKTKVRRNAHHIKSDTAHFPKINDPSYIEGSLDMVGALKVEPDQMGDLRLISCEGNWYIMTGFQYMGLNSWCNDVCPTPLAKKLRIKTKEDL